MTVQCGEKIIHLCMYNAIVAIREDRIYPDGGLPMGFTIRGIRSTNTLSIDIQNKLSYFFNRGQSIESFLDAMHHYTFFADAKGCDPPAVNKSSVTP